MLSNATVKEAGSTTTTSFRYKRAYQQVRQLEQLLKWLKGLEREALKLAEQSEDILEKVEEQRDSSM